MSSSDLRGKTDKTERIFSPVDEGKSVAVDEPEMNKNVVKSTYTMDRSTPGRRNRRLYHRSQEKGGVEGFRNTGKDYVGVEGSSSFAVKSSEEGPSNYHSELERVKDERAEVIRKLDDLKLEDDRIEILRKLDELKDQISRSFLDKSKEMVSRDKRVDHRNPYYGSEKSFSDGPLVSNHGPVYYSMPQNISRPYEVAMPSHYPSMYSADQAQNFVDPYTPRMLRRAPYETPVPIEQPYLPNFSGRYIHSNMVHTNTKLYNRENPRSLSSYSSIPALSDYRPLNYRDPEPYPRRSGDGNFGMGGFVSQHPQRVLSETRGQHCLPVANGAPFVICCNCSELLHLPKIFLSISKTQNKVQCAACFKVIVIRVLNKKLYCSLYSKADRKSDMAVDRSHAMLSTDFSSDDYDNSGCDFQSIDRLPVASLTGQLPSSSFQTAAMMSLHSVSSEDGDFGREDGKHTELPIDSKPDPPPSGSTLQDHFDYSTQYNRGGKGIIGGWSQIEKVDPMRGVSCKNSEERAVATEIEILPHEYSNVTGTSQDSWEGNREEVPARITKEAESSIAAKIKSTFKGMSRTIEHNGEKKVNVVVNKHAIPDQLVKKAEKLAGPIQPGEYWYDSRAGFWGIIGGPCRGIIPPFIEEFNYPMPDNCAGGNTGVFVNGRELHQHDLDLLISRGLPADRNKSYIIEISGRVLDQDSGEELDSLGKLAPSVEKAKRGFGMRPPRDSR